MSDPGPSPFKYHLELTPAQLKLTHQALGDLLAGLGEGREDSRRVIEEVLEMLPDEQAIAAIPLSDDGLERGADEDDDPGTPDPPDILA